MQKKVMRSSFEEVQENTGWTIAEKDAPAIAPPSKVELVALDAIDPNKIRLLEF